MKKHVIYLFLIAVYIPLACQSNKNSNANSKIFRVIFDLEPATTEYKYEGGKQVAIPVFKYDPSKEIKENLIKAGFKVVPQNSTNFDITLKISHRERVRQNNRYPGDYSQKTMIDHIGFVLEDKDGMSLIKLERGPFSAYTSMTFVKQTFIKDLIELVQIRMEKDNETSCWIEFISRRGDEASYNAIEKAGDPNYPVRIEQINVLKPMLRSHNLSIRILADRLLKKLEYSPSSEIEKTISFIVRSYPFHRWSAQVGESSTDAWAARQGVSAIIKYGTTAIDLFVDDLKGKEDLNTWRYGVKNGGVATRAKSVLERLTYEQWIKFGYAKFTSIGREVKYVDHKPELDFFNVKYFDFNNKLIGEVEVVNPKKASEVYSKVWNQEWNDYAITKLVEELEKGKNVSFIKDYLKNTGIDNKNYFRDIFEILGEIADSRTIVQLETFLINPELAEDTKRAIKKIKYKEQKNN